MPKANGSCLPLCYTTDRSSAKTSSRTHEQAVDYNSQCTHQGHVSANIIWLALDSRHWYYKCVSLDLQDSHHYEKVLSHPSSTGAPSSSATPSSVKTISLSPPADAWCTSQPADSRYEARRAMKRTIFAVFPYSSYWDMGTWVCFLWEVIWMLRYGESALHLMHWGRRPYPSNTTQICPCCLILSYNTAYTVHTVNGVHCLIRWVSITRC